MEPLDIFSWFLFQIWVFGIDSPFLFTIVGQTPSDFLHLHPFPNLGSRYSFEEICLERDWGSQTGGIPWSFSGHQKGWQYDCWQLEKCRTWSSHIVSQVWADHSCATQHPEMWAISSSLHFHCSRGLLFYSVIIPIYYWEASTLTIPCLGFCWNLFGGSIEMRMETTGSTLSMLTIWENVFRIICI